MTQTLFIWLEGVILEQTFVHKRCDFNLDLPDGNGSTMGKLHKARLASIVPKHPVLMIKINIPV